MDYGLNFNAGIQGEARDRFTKGKRDSAK